MNRIPSIIKKSLQYFEFVPKDKQLPWPSIPVSIVIAMSCFITLDNFASRCHPVDHHVTKTILSTPHGIEHKSEYTSAENGKNNNNENINSNVNVHNNVNNCNINNSNVNNNNVKNDWTLDRTPVSDWSRSTPSDSNSGGSPGSYRIMPPPPPPQSKKPPLCKFWVY